MKTTKASRIILLQIILDAFSEGLHRAYFWRMQKNLQQHFDEFINEYQYIGRRRPESIRILKASFRHFTTIMPEVSYPEDLSSTLITTFFMRLQTRERFVGKNEKRVGVKDSTVAAYGIRLRMFFQWLTNRRIMKANPFDDIKLPQPTFTDHRALKGNQIKMILGAVAQYAPNALLLRRDLAMIGVLTFCGLRRNELLSLELRDVDLYNNLLTINGETSKSKKTRKIPINLQLKKNLVDYLNERKKHRYKNPYLFVSSTSDRQLSKAGLKHWVERLCRSSGVKFHVHRFRHTFATNLAMQDVGAIKIQKLMGHSDLKMTQTYLRSISPEEMYDDVNKLSFEILE